MKWIAVALIVAGLALGRFAVGRAQPETDDAFVVDGLVSTLVLLNAAVALILIGVALLAIAAFTA